MRHSYRPDIPPKPQPYRTQVFDHLGLVAGMFEELGITEVIDTATQQDPEMRIVTAGHAVTAMVLNGLGFINHQLYRSCTSSLRLIRQTDRPGTIIPSLLYLYEVLLPWSPISFSTSWG
jgi:uncharacterized protein DUF4277